LYLILAISHGLKHPFTVRLPYSYINSGSVFLLLYKIKELHPTKLITLILDNASYQRCKAVQELAKELGIELLFLPSYSPNLNLIERLWKFVKKEKLYSTYYETFADFQQGINSVLEQTPLIKNN
jgi:transposase